MDLLCVDHVAVGVPPAQMGEAIAFYRDVLGLVHLYKDHPDFGSDPAMLCCTRGNNSNVSLTPHPTPGLLHLAFRTTEEGLADAVAKLQARGIPVRTADYGLQRSLYFTDPLGYQIEVTAWPTHASTHAGLGAAPSSSHLPPGAADKVAVAAPRPAVIFHHASFVAGLLTGLTLLSVARLAPGAAAKLLPRGWW